MNIYSLYIEIIYYNRWQNIINILKQLTIRYFTYAWHPLSKFKLFIEDDIHYCPLCTQNVIFIFTGKLATYLNIACTEEEGGVGCI